jgi:4-hydroxybenzoate polyprenyltransferase
MSKLSILSKGIIVYQRVNAAINRLENLKSPFLYFILTFAFAITLRFFIELLSTHDKIELIVFAHYSLFYTAIALSLILIFHLTTKTAVTKVAKVILPGFLILVIAPSIDLLISGGKGIRMTYLLPDVHNDLLWRFITFFGDLEAAGPIQEIGVTPGIKVELALVLLGSFYYFLVKRRNLLKSIGYTFLTYAILFVFAISPFIIKYFVELLGLGYNFSHELFISFFVTAIFLLGVAIAYFGNKQQFVNIIKDIRLVRIVYYFSMFALGVIIGLSNHVFELTATNLFHFIFIPISILFACLFSIVTNNIVDYEIDKISNHERPLITGNIRLDMYRKLAWVFFGLAMVYAVVVNFVTLFFILLFIGNYFLYSMPPLRLKRITFFSKLAISINSLALAMLGFLTITHSLTLNGFPGIAFPIILIGVTALANMIDIKDYYGDKQLGIKTLPVVLGLTWAKRVIGIFFLLTYGSIFFVVQYLNVPIYFFFVFILFGVAQFFLVNRKNYNERPVLLLCLFSIVVIIYFITQRAV